MCEMRRIHASDSTHMCACVKFLSQVMECLEKVMDIQAEKAFLKASPEAQRKWLLLHSHRVHIARVRVGGRASELSE